MQVDIDRAIVCGAGGRGLSKRATALATNSATTAARLGGASHLTPVVISYGRCSRSNETPGLRSWLSVSPGDVTVASHLHTEHYVIQEGLSRTESGLGRAIMSSSWPASTPGSQRHGKVDEGSAWQPARPATVSARRLRATRPTIRQDVSDGRPRVRPRACGPRR